jgi:PAS domain S-box-containing protein
MQISYDGIILYANHASEQLLQDWQCTIGLHVPQIIRQTLTTAIKTNEQSELIIRCQEKDISIIFVPIVERQYVNLYSRDITKQRQTEFALQKSSEYFSAVFRRNPIALAISKTEFLQLIDVNEKFVQLFGWSRDEIIGKRPLELGMFANPKDRDQILALLQSFGGVENYELEIRTKSGDYRPALLSAEILALSSGRLFLTTIQDISQSKMAKEELRRRAEEVQTLLNIAPVAIWVADDPNCENITGNTAANRLYEAKESENVSANASNIRRFFHRGTELKPEELPMQQAAKNNTEIRNSEIDILLPSGEWRNLLGSAIPLQNNENHVRGSVAAFLDITEHNKAATKEVKMRSLMAKAETLSHTGAWECDLVKNQWTFSEECQAIHGAGKSNLTTDELLQIVYPDDRKMVAQALDNFIKGKTGFNIIYRIIGKNGPILRMIHSVGRSIKDPAHRIKTIYGYSQDFSELKLAEDTLIRYKLLAEHTNDIILFIRAQDGHIIQANAAAVQAYGHSSKELLQLTISDLQTGSFSLQIPKQMRIAEQQGIYFETMHHRKDGSTFPVEIFSKTAFFSGEWLFLCIIRDISKDRQMEQKLRDGEERFSKAFRSSPAALVIVRASDGTFLEVNGAFEQLLGYTQDQLVEKSIIDLNIVQNPEQGNEISRSLKETGAINSREIRLRRKDGQFIDVIASIETIAIGNQKTYIASLIDITERKQTEETLRLSEERYRGLIESQQEPLSRIDADHKITFVNDAFCQMFGKDRNNIIGRSFDELANPDYLQQIAQSIAELDKPPFRATVEELALTKQGKRWIEWEAVPIKDKDGNTIEIQARAVIFTTEKWQ